MRKYIYLVIALSMTCHYGYSQSVTTDPATFTPTDEVTITFDVSNTGLANFTGDAYIWTWRLPEGLNDGSLGDAPTNVNPAGPGQAAAKLTRSATNPNIYSITFVPTEFFGVSLTEIPRMGVIAKGPDWSNGQTGNFYLDVLPPVFSSPVVRIFPIQFTSQDVVSVFYDTNLEENVAMKNAGSYYLHTTIEGTNANGVALNPASYVVPIGAKTKLTSVGNGIYWITFIPERFYTLNPGDVLKKIQYRIQNESGSLTNPPAGFDMLNVTVRKQAK
jgi:hypothetical protein